MDFYDECKQYCLSRRPTKSILRKFMRSCVRVEFEGKVYWSYPQRPNPRCKAPELPKEIRIGKGVEPTTKELERIQAIFAAFKPTLGYVSIAGLVYLFGRDIAAQLTWMVKNGQAGLSVD